VQSQATIANTGTFMTSDNGLILEGTFAMEEQKEPPRNQQ